MEFAVITDAYDWQVMRASATPEAPVWVPSNPGGIPTPDQLVEFELIVVVGSLSEPGAALQLAGVVKLAMERSKGTCVFAHPPHLSEHDAHFMEAMGLPIPYGNRADHVKRYPDEFHAYFTEYGMSGSAYNSTDTEDAITLGWIYDNEGMLERAALCWETETRGVIYTVPYYVAKSGNPARMVGALREAVTAHRDTLSAGLPGYLSDVRIGEVELGLLAEIDSQSTALKLKQEEASALERWRHLIGRTSGAPLVQLAVEALNVLLEGTGKRAVTRTDVGAEDFWIVDADENDIALAESKGIASGIARSNVSQVDSHREARKKGPEFPGLLIVNAFRGDPDLTRKQGEAVAPNVIELAKSQNVVVMRTWDLYQLLGRRLDGEPVGEQLLAWLNDEQGGWLRVDAAGVTVVQ
jgi:hypothetical protein